MIDCSIIIVNCNTALLLRQCLDSLKSEIQSASWRTEIGIVIVDNGSTDESVEMLGKYIEESSCQFVSNTENHTKKEELRVSLIKNQTNLGFAKAVNQGIKRSEGKTILLLNSDTRVKKDFIKNLLKFEQRVKPVIIGARMINPDGSTQPSVFHLPTVKGAFSEYWLGKKGSFSKYEPLGENSQEVEAVSGGAMLISRKVIDKIGFFNEKYFFYFEDLDYCRRAKKAGFKIYFLPSAEVIHEHGASGKNLVSSENQWRRLVPSSKIYHGIIKHYLINFIIWLGQKFHRSISVLKK